MLRNACSGRCELLPLKARIGPGLRHALGRRNLSFGSWGMADSHALTQLLRSSNEGDEQALERWHFYCMANYIASLTGTFGERAATDFDIVVISAP
jgi:hypothetical protein